jgi:hypothetical protein
MSSTYDQAVNTFLNQLGTSTFSSAMLNKIWKAFMAYSACLVSEAFRIRGYNVTAQNCAAGFVFKCFPQGDPANYSYFLAQNGTEKLEIRLNIDCQNFQFNSITLNMDIVVIRPNSISTNWVVDAETDLVTFAECKNLRGFPELVATIEGMAFELQRPRVWSNGAANYRIPCCLLVSGPGTTIIRRNTVYGNRGYSLRIFHMLQPGSPEVQRFIQTWF